MTPADAAALAPAWRAIAGAAQRIAAGELTLVLPGGLRLTARGSAPGPAAEIVVRRARAGRRILLGGGIGAAESYMDGDWDTPDLEAALELFCVNDGAFERLGRGASALAALQRFYHRLRTNTRAGARRNIAQHYDLGNAFYARWLDPTLTYSSAVFDRPNQDFAEAQRNKWRLIADKLAAEPGHRVLEIGCGWGGFARYLARDRGCRVVGITLSREQFEFGCAKAQAEGLADRVEIRLQDYRDVRERFDRIASIEMFEAVGEKYWPDYFATLRDCLAPDGRAALQTIVIADRWFDAYRKGADFIQRYIFPGGMLPSPGALMREIGRAGLKRVEEDRFALHYARTLAEWRRRFLGAWPEIAQLGFDGRFRRMWEFYLAYCEAGFRAGSIDVAQVAVVRA